MLVNCSKTQYKRNHSRCFDCIESPATGSLVQYYVLSSSSNEPMLGSSWFLRSDHQMKSPTQEDRERVEWAKLMDQMDDLDDYNIASIDFEVYCRDPTKILEFGICYYDSCCFHLVCLHFVVQDYVHLKNKYDLDSKHRFQYGVSKMISLYELYWLLKKFNDRFHHFIVCDAHLETKILIAMGLPVFGKMIDIQVLAMPTNPCRRSLEYLCTNDHVRVVDFHNAGNDAVGQFGWWILVYTNFVTVTLNVENFMDLVEIDFSPSSVLDFNYINLRCRCCHVDISMSIADQFVTDRVNYYRFVRLFRDVCNHKLIGVI